MNIKDIDPSKLPPVEGDMLTALFNLQSEIERKYRVIEGVNGFFPGIGVPEGGLNLHDPEVNWFLKDASQRIIEELCEGTNLLKNKQWKNTPVMVDEDHFLEELSDALHFFIRYAIYVLGTGEAGARRLFELYRRKHEVNKFRQESNY